MLIGEKCKFVFDRGLNLITCGHRSDTADGSEIHATSWFGNGMNPRICAVIDVGRNPHELIGGLSHELTRVLSFFISQLDFFHQSNCPWG